MFGEHIWAFVVVGGFLILGGLMAYAKLRNRAAGADEPTRPDATPPNYGEIREDR